MTIYRLNGRRRLGRPSKVLLDKPETSLLIHLNSIHFSGLCPAPKILDDGQSPKKQGYMLSSEHYGAEDY